MSNWKVILATLVIFGAGVVTGSLMVRSSPRPQPPPPPWKFNNPEFLKKLERSLELSPQQYERIEQILRHSKDRTQPLWREISPRLGEEVKCVRKEIKAVLTPGQQERFDEIMRPHAQRKPEDPKGGGPREAKRPGTNMLTAPELVPREER